MSKKSRNRVLVVLLALVLGASAAMAKGIDRSDWVSLYEPTYNVYTYIRNSDGLGWNYQGTMTRGTVTAGAYTYCSTAATRRTGSTSTATAGSGSVVSTNTRVP